MITVVIGGQFGSEGKGEIVADIAKHHNVIACCRTGGPNAGHTVTGYSREPIKMRHVPAAWVNPQTRLFLSPGGLLHEDVLEDELQLLVGAGWSGEFQIDRNAVWIEDEHVQREYSAMMRARIGSTTEGIGAARSDKIMRVAETAEMRARRDDGNYSHPRLRVVDVPKALNMFADIPSTWSNPYAILLESTQGFGLSLELSGFYPFCTSANITPGHIMGECGLSTQLEHSVVAVMRTFPIRVAGNSGPLRDEISWEQLHKESAGRAPLDGERTTVTKLVRRIGRWDKELAERMSMVCRPTNIALTFLDYVFPDLADITDLGQIMGRQDVTDYLDQIEQDCNAGVKWISTGPGKITEVE